MPDINRESARLQQTRVCISVLFIDDPTAIYKLSGIHRWLQRDTGTPARITNLKFRHVQFPAARRHSAANAATDHVVKALSKQHNGNEQINLHAQQAIALP